MASRGISLANKCQLLFGAAVVAILGMALGVAWVRTDTLIRESQVEVSRQLADAWLRNRPTIPTSPLTSGLPSEPVLMTLYRLEALDGDAPRNRASRFGGAALAAFREDPERTEFVAAESTEDGTVYQYARAIPESKLRTIEFPSWGTSFTPTVLDAGLTDPLRAVLVIERESRFARGQLLINRIYIVASGLFATLLAILVFYLILTKLILSPVRRLRATSELVQQGDLTVRSSIRTGDEFEQLSDAFNAMLDRVQQTQSQLQSLNESLDLKVTELAEANVGLYDSNRLKSEFLANVSHELRTPLNSIIGFAELLEELARGDEAADPKRARYLENILTSGRSLLEMINELLEMAKIEAGRIELGIEQTSLADLVEGLQAIMRPQAETKEITVETHVARTLPAVETDPGKLQQILYNFLSNAIKFSPRQETVTITAERVTRQDQSQGVRIGITDRGPGIPDDMQDVIFEKFRQLDASHTRQHAGTGLGLAICRELAEMLGATVSVISEPGHGATFYVDLPVTHQPSRLQPLMD
jgi:signal transduction histidine kinase